MGRDGREILMAYKAKNIRSQQLFHNQSYLFEEVSNMIMSIRLESDIEGMMSRKGGK